MIFFFKEFPLRSVGTLSYLDIERTPNRVCVAIQSLKLAKIMSTKVDPDSQIYIRHRYTYGCFQK